MEYVIGADEAGRGCVLGSLVMTAFAVEEKKEHALKLAGARDSKELTPQKRESIRKELETLGEHRTTHITAGQINDAMGSKVSLNELEARRLAILLADFAKEIEARGDKVKTIYVDSPDPIPIKYEKRIRAVAPSLAKIKIVSDNKSENKYPCVAAASIVAKTTRDFELEKIKKIFGEDFGTGYTHDKVTIDFVKRHLHDAKLEPFLRIHWKTVKNMQTVQVDLKKFI